MQQTTNFGLQKPEPLIDNVDITVLNGNMDKTDKLLGNTANFEKSGGTATVITLSGLDALLDGISKTFIASANNGSAATTINSKPLYKPGTTTAPNLVAGKAYTVWYDLAGDCFFIKASAEGDAVAANVLAGKKFSNDSDTGIEGTMPNNGSVIITPGTVNKPIAKGYHDGNGYVAGDPDLISANIKSGANIFGIAGNPNVVDTSAGDALAEHMLSGKKAYVDGALVTGNIPNKAAATITPGTTNQTIAAGQYLSGIQTILGDADLIAANILSGKNIFGVAGSVIAGKRWASGTKSITATSSIYFTHADGTNYASYPLTVSGLTFNPSLVIAYNDSTTENYITILFHSVLPATYSSLGRIIVTRYAKNNQESNTQAIIRLSGNANNSLGFQIPVAYTIAAYNWIAIE